MERLSEFTTSHIDLSIPPVRIDGYRLGDCVTRENFTNFIIDSFAKSRGNPSKQAYYFSWTNLQVSPNSIAVLDDYIDFSRKKKLTETEMFNFNQKYRGVRAHEDWKAQDLNTERIENAFLKMTLFDALKKCPESNYFANSEPMDQAILGLSRGDFMQWLRIKPRSFYLEDQP